MKFVKYTLLLVLFFHSSPLLFSQAGIPRFLSIGTSSGNERGSAVYVKSDGSYFVGGSKNDSALIIYLSNTDNIIWSKTFKFTPYSCFVNYLSMTSDGYVIGAAASYGTVFYGSCFKIDPATGNFMWNNQFNGNNLYITRIIEKSSTEYICIGGEYPSPSPNYGVDAKNVTVSASTGSITAQSNCIGLQSYNWLDDLEAATDLTNGFFFTSGRSYLQNLTSKMRSNLFKYDSNGNLVWSEYLHKPPTGTSRMYTRDMIMYGPAHMLLFYLADDVCSGGCNDYYPGLMLIDTTGTVVWDKLYNIPASNAEYIEKVNVMGNSIYMSGYTNINSGNNDAFILKTDLSGNVQACNKYGSPVLNEKNTLNFTTAGDCRNGLFYFVYSAELGNLADINILKLDSTLNLPCYPGTTLAVTAATIAPYQTAFPPQYNPSIFTVSSNTSYSASLANPCISSLSRIVDTIYVAGVDTILSAFTSTATSYSWNTGATTATLHVTNTQADSVLVFSGCCPAVKHVYYVYICNISISVSSISLICHGQTGTLSATGALSYTWLPVGSTLSTVAVSPGATTVYTVLCEGPAGCIKSQTVIQTVIPYPMLSVLPSSSIGCAGSLVTIIASGASSYTWLPLNLQASSITVAPGASAVYTLQGANGACVSSVTVPLTIIPPPVVIVAGSPTVLCSGQSTSLSASGAGSYVWQPGNLSGSVIVVSPSASTHYTLSGSNGVCSGTVALYVEVVPAPDLSITPGSLNLCSGATLAVTATGAQNYSWSPASAFSTISGASVILTATSTTVITLTGSNSSGTLVCSLTENVPISVLPYVIPSVSDSIEICINDTATLKAYGGSTFLWHGNKIIYTAGNLALVKPKVSSVYSVTVSELNHCSKTVTAMVTVDPLPYVFAGNDTTFNRLDNITINAESNASIKWTNGEGIVCNYCLTTPISIKFPGQKSCYTAEAINTFGCKAWDDVCITVTDDYAVYIPNTFTPNNDGINDVFYVYGFGISDLEIEVFDRWGEELFSDNSQPEHGWNGFYKGKLCQSDIYVYRIAYKLASRQYSKTGFVNLVR